MRPTPPSAAPRATGAPGAPTSRGVRLRRAAAALLASLVVLAVAATAFAGGGPAETVVLVNTASADSRRVADHYVRARGIPPDQVCEVRCTPSLDVPMNDFVRDVVDPLRTFLRRRGLEDRCRFVVVTQGMPIVARTPGGHVSTTAALALLDSPLCGMPQTRMPTVPNPYTTGPAPAGRIAGGSRFLLVTALLSTTADEAIALVDRSVAADGTAPPAALFLYQDAKPAAHVRNAAYDAARARIEAAGHRTERLGIGGDRAAGRKGVMGYMAGGAYSDLTAGGVRDVGYLPGAICDHLQSYGAVPGNFSADVKAHSQFPVTHMVRAGVTGVHGAVAEPYNVAFPDADLFLPYVEGATLAETFHQRMPLAYWMNLVLGDPLCAPYAQRPAVVVTGAPEGKWTGRVALRVAAPGASRVALYVNGTEVAAADGERLDADVDTSRFADGPAHVLAQAVGPGAYEPRGWRVLAATFANGTRAAPAPQRVGPAALGVTVDAPSEVRAGEEFRVRVAPRAAPGGAAWSGRIEVRLSDPPVRIAALDVDAAQGPVDVPARFTRAGDLDLRITLPDDGVETVARLRVRAAPARHATSPLAAIPLGQPTDVDVVFEDEFGNVADDGDVTLSMALPDDPGATVPGAVRTRGGRAVFRDVVATRPGRLSLVLTDATGRRWSQPGEGFEAQRSAIRAWLAATPSRGQDAAAAFAADPCDGADGDGCVAGGRLFRRIRSPRDDVALPAPATRDGDAVAAVTTLETSDPVKIRFLGAAPARLRIVLDGKSVYDASPAAKDPRGKREALAEVDLAAGRHRLTVVVERKDRCAFALEIDDGKGGAVAGLRVRPTEPAEPPFAFVASGSVRRGQGGLAGAVVTLRSSDGAVHRTTSAADGSWWIPGVPAGSATIRCEAGGRAAVPAEIAVDLAGAHATDLTFTLEDRQPPTVRADAGAGRFGRRLVVVASPEDDDRVREVRLLVEGGVVARAAAAPWRLEADVAALPRGPHAVEVVAEDASGNTARTTVDVRLIDDGKGPAVTWKGLAPNGVLRKKTTVIADVKDDLPVTEVRFALDGTDLATRTAAPYGVDLDPASLTDGAHVLTVTAYDLDRNETRAELRFRTR